MPIHLGRTSRGTEKVCQKVARNNTETGLFFFLPFISNCLCFVFVFLSLDARKHTRESLTSQEHSAASRGERAEHGESSLKPLCLRLFLCALATISGSTAEDAFFSSLWDTIEHFLWIGRRSKSFSLSLSPGSLFLLFMTGPAIIGWF